MKAVEAAVEGGLADGIVDDVDAFASGEALDLSFEVLLGVENHVGCACLAGELGFGLGGNSCDDARANACGDLSEEQADTAGSGMHQRRVAFFKRIGGERKIVRGHSLQQGCGRAL